MLQEFAKSNMFEIYIDFISGLKFGVELFFKGDLEDEDEHGIQFDLGIIRITFVK